MHMIHGTDIYAGFVPMFGLDLQGWNSDHPVFRDAIASSRPAVVIDVGVWKGRSSINLANLLREHDIDGAVIAVDTFLGGLERWNDQAEWFALVPRQYGRPLLYEQFLANVVRSGAADTVIPVPRVSQHAAMMLKRAGVSAGLIHIDASHEYEGVLLDCRLYWEILEPGGWMIGDDYSPSWPGVVRAADEFAREKGCKLTEASPKWIVRKPA
jgi:hypothetical protein